MNRVLVCGVLIGALMEAAGVDAISTAVAADELTLRPAKQRTLTCPAGWAEFCGGWTIADMTVEGGGQPDEHMQQGDRFVIGASDGRLKLLPRDALKEKWGEPIDLELLEDESGRCVTGRVQLGHDGVSKWQRITLTAGLAVADGEVGTETVLNVMTSDELADDLGSYASCMDLALRASPALEPAHAGFGHAED